MATPVCVRTFYPLGISARSTGACFLAHSLIYLPITTIPLTPYTHIEVVRVQSSVHKGPTELNKLAPFQKISHLSYTAYSRAEPPCSPYLENTKTHTPTHTHTYKTQLNTICCLAFRNNRVNSAQVYKATYLNPPWSTWGASLSTKHQHTQHWHGLQHGTNSRQML